MRVEYWKRGDIGDGPYEVWVDSRVKEGVKKVRRQVNCNRLFPKGTWSLREIVLK